MRALRAVYSLSLITAALTGCSGSSGSAPGTAPLTLSVTDAPANAAEIERVCVDFTRITIHYAGMADVALDYEPLPSQVSPDTHCVAGAWDGSMPPPPVRVDALGGPLSVALAESLQVPVGRITWIRLHFTNGAYVVDNLGGEHPLRCPSCEPTDNNQGRGFKLNRTIELTSSGAALTVDIDLLKSLHMDSNGYVLRPTARMELDQTLGAIVGEVHADVLAGAGGTAYTGTDLDTGCAVYIYADLGITPDDYYDGSPVLTSARVRYDTARGIYAYAAGALPGGTETTPVPYTVALTCAADDPLFDESDMDVPFSAGQDATVIAGEAKVVDFLP